MTEKDKQTLHKALPWLLILLFLMCAICPAFIFFALLFGIIGLLVYLVPPKHDQE